jgi:hypothetical protein
MFWGTTKLVNFTVTLDDVAVNLTGTTLRFEARQTYLSDTLIEKHTGRGITITDAAAGECQVKINAADTASFTQTTHNLKYDLRYTAGTESHIVAVGTLVIRPATVLA